MRLRNLSIVSLVFIPTPVLATTYVCEACPAGTWGDGTNCNKCSAGTYAYAGASSCTNCLTTGVKSCDSKTGKATSCKSGFGLLSSGACARCSAGTYSYGGTGGCSSCSSGYYSNAGASSCTSCLKAGVASCSATTGKATSCSAGYGFSNGTCTICATGTYSAGGTSSCTACSGASGTSWDVGSCGIIGGTYYTYCDKQGSTYSTDGAISHRTSKDVGGCGSGNYCSSGSCYSCGSVSNGSYSSNGLTSGSCSLSCVKGYKVEDGACHQTAKCEERGVPTGCGNNCPSPSPYTLGIMTKKECSQVKRGGSCEILWDGKHLKRCSLF